MQVVFALLAVVVIGASPVIAQPAATPSAPDANTLMKQMKEAFEPSRPSTRKVIISIADSGQTVRLVGRVARKKVENSRRQAMVVTEPADVLGTAMLMIEPQDPTKPSTMWMYSPVIRRVRKLIPIEAYDHFLDTDFTYADLGYVRLHGRYTYLGEAEVKGVKAYKVEEKIPRDEWYYSRVVTYIAAGNKMPLQRDYYDPAGALWKTERFDTITDIDGVPTVLHAVMKDVQSGTSTDLAISEVRYDVDVLDSVLDPQQLSKLADSPIWQTPPAK